VTGPRPRNYLAPAERRRLFWRVVPVACALLIVIGWLERVWSPPHKSLVQQVDTRLESVEGPRPLGETVIIEAEAPALEAGPEELLAAPRAALARVRDATLFREADNDAWLQTWLTLRDQGRAGLMRAGPTDVGFAEVFGQPRSFRGRLVRMRGTLRRAEPMQAPDNDYGVRDYWQCWMEPAGGPPSPVIVQCLTLPEDCPAGMSIDVPVDVVGFFLKNVAYNATDAIRVAPVILALEPIRLATPSPPAAITGFGGVAMAVTIGLVGVMAVAWLAATRPRGAAPRRGASPHLPDTLAVGEVSTEESLRRLAAEASMESSHEREPP